MFLNLLEQPLVTFYPLRMRNIVWNIKIMKFFSPSKCGARSGEAETEFPARTLLQLAKLPKSKWQSNQELRNMSQEIPLKFKIISHALQTITVL